MEFFLVLGISDTEQELHMNTDDSRKPDQFNLICSPVFKIKDDNPWV